MRANYQKIRPIVAMVASAVALPLLATVNMPTPWRRAVLPIFAVACVLWTFWFYKLRTRGQTLRGTFVLVGVALGLLPSAIFYVASVLAEQPAPPVAMLAIGIVTGAFCGVALCDLTPFPRDARPK
jgi:hypothetical protein